MQSRLYSRLLAESASSNCGCHLGQTRKKREFFGVKKEWVVPFDLIPIIDAGAQLFWRFMHDRFHVWVSLTR